MFNVVVVSTNNPNPDANVTALKNLQVQSVYVDGINLINKLPSNSWICTHNITIYNGSKTAICP